MQQTEHVRFWQQYEHSLRLIRYSIIGLETLLVCIRIYIVKMPTFICVLEMMMIMLLWFMSPKTQIQQQAKLYIMLNLAIILFIFLNFLGSFTTPEPSKILYEENLPNATKQRLYPIQLVARVFFILVGWRIFQFSKLKHLYDPEHEFAEIETQSNVSN